MKKINFVLLLLIVTCGKIFAQIENPVKWSYAAQKIAGSEYNLLIKATMQPGWHIYSAFQKDGGPAKTDITIDLVNVVLLGALKEPKPIVKFEKAFGIDVAYFDREAIFTQKIKVKTKPTKITGTISYMTCNDQKCINPEPVAFSVPVK